VILEPYEGDPEGHKTFRIINTLFVPANGAPVVPMYPKRVFVANKYFGEVQTHDVYEEDPAGLVDPTGHDTHDDPSKYDPIGQTHLSSTMTVPASQA
jgi:hypothetical protein